MEKIIEYTLPEENTGKIFYFNEPIHFEKEQEMKIIVKTKQNEETKVSVLIDR